MAFCQPGFMRTKKPRVRHEESVVSVVREHAERLMAESPFCGLLSPEQWQRELDALELMLARLLMDLLLADNQGVPLSEAVYQHDAFPHLGRVHGSLMDMWCLAVPEELQPIVRAGLTAQPPAWVSEVRTATCVVAASPQANPAERALAKFTVFEGVVLNLMIAARRTNGHFEGVGCGRRDIERRAEVAMCELLAAPPGLGDGTVRPFEVTVVAAMEDLERYARKLWKTQVKDARDAGRAIEDVEAVFEMRRRLELELRHAEPIDAAVMRHALTPPHLPKAPVAHLPKQHPLILDGMTPNALDQRVSRATDRLTSRRGGLARRGQKTLLDLIDDVEASNA